MLRIGIIRARDKAAFILNGREIFKWIGTIIGVKCGCLLISLPLPILFIDLVLTLNWVWLLENQAPKAADVRVDAIVLIVEVHQRVIDQLE